MKTSLKLVRITKLSLTALYCGLISILLTPGVHAAVIVANPNFTPGLSPWVGVGGTGAENTGSPYYPYSVFSGPFGRIQEAGTLTQDITLVANSTYTLTLESASRGGSDSLPAVTIFNGLTNVSLYLGVINEGNTNVALANDQYNFILNTFTFSTTTVGAGAYIQLANLKPESAGDNTADFRGVVITLDSTATPEPSTYALLGCGLMGMAIMLRVRKLNRI